MPHALSLPFRSMLSLAANRPKLTLGILLAVAGLATVIVQVAMAAVTMNPLTDGTTARSVFKPGDVIHASGNVDSGKHWRFVRVNGTTVTPIGSCSAVAGAVSTTYTVQSTDAEGAWSFQL